MFTGMNKLKIIYAVVLIGLVVLESHIGILPMMIWGLGFPLAAIAKNWRAVRRQTLWNHLTLFLSDTFLPVTYPV